MYFPYLRGKQEEVLAIRQADFLSDLTVPIFEPTNLSHDTCKRWRLAIQAGRRFAIITNSANGAPPPASDDVVSFVDGLSADAVFPGLEIRANTDVGMIRGFAERFQGRTCVVVHRNHLYSPSELSTHLALLADEIVHVLIDGGVPRDVLRNLSARGTVLLKDGFHYKTRNADYPSHSHFDELLHTFEGGGFDGFGDFTIVGDRFSPGGGPAYAVALHLTEVTPTTIVTNHFVSSPPHISGELRGKYLSALGKLVANTEGKRRFGTAGVNAFRDCWTRKHNPGLGQPKRWSILHHLEIIERRLIARGMSAFV